MHDRLDWVKRFISAAAAAVMAVVALPVGAFAASEGETVVVGAWPGFGVNVTGSEYSGFAVDYLAEIQKRTGHRYSYVQADPDELVEMLAQGKVDVIPCVGDSQLECYEDILSESEYAPQKSRLSLMTRFSAVYVREDSNIDFYDTEQLNYERIGYLAEMKTQYFPDGRFIASELEGAEFVEYSSVSQMQEDLYSGKLGAVVKECFLNWSDEAIVYQFSTEDCHFLVSGADKRLAAELDDAVGGIYVCDSGFSSDLYDKHLAKYGVQNYAFTAAEKEFLENTPSIKVAYNLQANMLELYDHNSKQLIGLTNDMLEEIEKYTGVELEIEVCSTLAECVEKLDAGEVQAVCGGVNSSSMSLLGSYIVSSPYARVPIAIAGKRSDQLHNYMKVAVPFCGDDVISYLKQLYPSATFLPYDDVKSCMNAVRSGQADVICAGAYEMLSLINSGYSDIIVLEVNSAFHTECLAYASDSPPELVSVIGKALARINNNTAVVSSFTGITTYGYDSMTMSRFLQEYFLLIVIAVGVLLAAAAVVILVMIYKNRKATRVDKLTGGRTKMKFIEDAQRLVRKSQPERWAIVLFDINKFKFVNDRLGYEEGNRMLERLYKTIDDHLEKDEIFARLSDDNFACAIHDSQDNELTLRITNIFNEFERRNSLFVKYPVVFSAGVCRLGQCLKESGSTVDINAALDRCTIAKRTLKGQHYSSIAFYDGKIRDKALREKDYENLMPAALAQHEFECYLQPKYGLKTRHIEGAEALIRWNSKEFGFVVPNDFIPISEKNGFVVELDFFVLEEVCKAMRRWINEGKTPVVVSVNQSRLHLNYDDYIWRLREIVDKYDIPYGYIELELTESVFMENAETLLKIMHKLHEIGFKLSLDDFGSGYSSLNMLKDIPVDVVKIDREFFNGTVNSEKGRAVISTVVDLAKNLNMEVISEGVETLEQVEFLTDIKCAMVQGYYFAKPMTISAFEELWNKDLKEISMEREAQEKAQEEHTEQEN